MGPNAVGGTAQVALDPVTGRGLVERGLQAHQRGHETGRRDRRRPLLDVHEVSCVEGQQLAASCFPHAVTVTEAGERTLMPRAYGAHPRVAERLTVGPAEVCIYGDGVRTCRGLRVVPGVFEREVSALLLGILARRSRCGGPARRAGRPTPGD